jgi:DNA-binding beta-propeller fold protein YncE
MRPPSAPGHTQAVNQICCFGKHNACYELGKLEEALGSQWRLEMFFEIATFAGTGTQGTADGPTSTATFDQPSWLAVSPLGIVYVAETFSNGLRKIEGGAVSTLINRVDGNVDGPLSSALFAGPSGIVSDRAGNLYIADQANHRIRKIDTGGNVTTVAGPSGKEQLRGWVDDLLSEALFCRPKPIAIDAIDATLYLAEHNRIRSIPLRFLSGRNIMEVHTVAALGIKGFADGPPTVAQFSHPEGLAVTQLGEILVADTGNFRIRRISPSGVVSTLAGDGVPAVPTDETQFADGRPALHARFERPSGVAVDQAGTVYITDHTHVRIYSPLTNTVSTVCSDATHHQKPILFERAMGIAISQGRIFVSDSNKIVVLTPHDD